MRIHQIRFQNLNSLAGEWEIDLSNPAYLSDGIFAITGPTGAGKTTILDAICLALYGRTPRLERVNKSSNEIMSRHTGSCFAEISFETREGHYRCHWSQQRARKKPDGELQAPKHEISDVNTGQVLENKLRDVAVRVEQITGMNFNQFTRSMMLAQGGFAAFLQAPADERAPILEQITGTEIYSEISMKVHQRRGEVKNQLEVLQAEITGIKVLSDDEEHNLSEELRINTELATGQAGQLKWLGEALAWLQTLDELENEINTLQKLWQDYEKRQEAFQGDQLRLNRARQAIALDGPYARLANLRELQTRELSEMEKITADLPLQRETRDRAEQVLEYARQHLITLKELRKTEGEKAARVRVLDLTIKQQGQQIGEIEKAVADGETTSAALQEKLNAGKQQLQEIERTLGEIERYLLENSGDTGLVANLAGIAATFKRLEEMVSARYDKEREWQQAAEGLKSLKQAREEMAAAHEANDRTLRKQLERLQGLQEELKILNQGHEIDWWRERLDQSKERQLRLQELEQSLNEISGMETSLEQGHQSIKELEDQAKQLTAEIDHWTEKAAENEREATHLETEVSLLNRIRDLEEERARLQDGNPCPLCGATDHPFARGNVPRVDETERALNEARKSLKQSNQELQKRQLEKVEVDKELEHCINTCQETEHSLNKALENRNRLTGELELNLPGQDPLPGLQALIKETSETVKQYSQQIKLIENMQKGERELAAEYEACRTVFNDSVTALQQADWQQKQAQNDHERIYNEYLTLGAETDKLHQAALSEVSPYGIIDLPLEDLKSILDGLHKRKSNWESQQNAKIAGEKSRGIAEAEITNLAARLQEQQEAIRQEQTRLEQQQNQQLMYRTERFELYGALNPDEEESRLDAEVLKGEEAVEQARQEAETAGRSVEGMEKREQTLADTTRLRAPELHQSEQNFTRLLQEAGFANEPEYIQAKLTADEEQALMKLEEKLKREKTELETRITDKQENRRREIDKKITEQSREALQEKQQLCERELEELRKKIWSDEHALADNEKNRRQMQQQLKRIEEQKKDLDRWQLLHDLIGSADGKKFRNFAQGLTFDIMIGHANRQLQKMTDRYLLRRNPHQTLELDVIDYYQAGETRSTANLSGGESFLVSLALALGLSNMASKKVSVDSLFLDEGFGVLDEEALDTALNTLAELHQHGKLIGVISHVSALKERISNQIKVVPLSGGRSTLQGPGCTGS